MCFRLSGLVFGLWRIACAGLVTWLAASCGPVPYGLVLYAGLETLLGVMSCLNSWLAREVDGRPVGWLVPAMYGVGLVVLPVAGSSPLSDALLAGCVSLRALTLVYLNFGSTCGVSTFYELCDSGPYRFVRHPMQLSGVLTRIAVCVANPLAWNWVGLAIMLGACVLIIRVEEGFLSTVPEWRVYAARVRWRLFPRVW
jgi:protein-S-isoprenylcysteine O-methyltransferase Ste14